MAALQWNFLFKLRAMAASFVKTLKATDKFLGNIAKLPSAASIEKQQLEKLTRIIERAQLWGPEEAASVTEAVGECLNFGDASKQSLLEHIAMKISCEEPDDDEKKNDRRKLQDYTMLPVWIPGSIWEKVMNLAIPKDHIVHLLCVHAHKCGLVNPTEATFGVIVCLACWALWSDHETSQSSRYQSLKILKPKIRQTLGLLAKDDPVPNEKRLKSLPHDVSDIPTVLEGTFAKEKLDSIHHVLFPCCFVEFCWLCRFC